MRMLGSASFMARLPAGIGILDLGWRFRNNRSMQIPGCVHNGVVVLDGGATLPEGTRVVVSQLSPRDQHREPGKKPAELPLVPGGEPGSVHLTNERIYQLLDEDDIEAMRRTWGVPS